MRKSRSIIAICALLCVNIGAQTIKFEDVPDRDGLQIGYNRFEDRTTLATKRYVVEAVAGKSRFDGSHWRVMEIQALAIWKGQQPGEPIGEILFAIHPQPQTKLGSMASRTQDQPNFYISPESRIIAIADGERVELGPVIKPGGINVYGDYSGTVAGIVPLTSYRKLVAAGKLELAVGPIEIKLTKRNIERLRTLLAEIDHRQPRPKNE